jgi:hypothetical protein
MPKLYFKIMIAIGTLDSLFIRLCIICPCLLGVTGSERTPVKAHPLQAKIQDIRLEFLTAAIMKINIFGEVTSYRLVEINVSEGSPTSIFRVLVSSDYSGSNILRNAGNSVPN